MMDNKEVPLDEVPVETLLDICLNLLHLPLKKIRLMQRDELLKTIRKQGVISLLIQKKEK